MKLEQVERRVKGRTCLALRGNLHRRRDGVRSSRPRPRARAPQFAHHRRDRPALAPADTATGTAALPAPCWPPSSPPRRMPRRVRRTCRRVRCNGATLAVALAGVTAVAVIVSLAGATAATVAGALAGAAGVMATVFTIFGVSTELLAVWIIGGAAGTGAAFGAASAIAGLTVSVGFAAAICEALPDHVVARRPARHRPASGCAPPPLLS